MTFSYPTVVLEVQIYIFLQYGEYFFKLKMDCTRLLCYKWDIIVSFSSVVLDYQKRLVGVDIEGYARCFEAWLP